MDQSDKSPSLTVITVASLALHGLLAWGMEGGAHAVAPVHHEPVRVTVREVPRPAPVVAEPGPEREAAPMVKRAEPAVAPQRTARSKETRIAKETQQPAAPEPAAALDFTGLTLTSPHGGFAAIAGNGERMDGPLGVAHHGSRHGSNPHGDGKGAAQGTELVALGSLSRPPRAPALDDALAANYPKNAHDLGLSGEAVVRARILPSGDVAATHVLVASAPEFGKACQRTLAGSHWTAPLDARGNPVATELSYKCVFEVTH